MHMQNGLRRVLVAGCLCVSMATTGQGQQPVPAITAGPLRTHPDDSRYFTDGTGQAIYLTDGDLTDGDLTDGDLTDGDANGNGNGEETNTN